MFVLFSVPKNKITTNLNDAVRNTIRKPSEPQNSFTFLIRPQTDLYCLLCCLTPLLDCLLFLVRYSYVILVIM